MTIVPENYDILDIIRKITPKVRICVKCLCEMEGEWAPDMQFHNSHCPSCEEFEYLEITIDEFKSLVRNKKIDDII